MRHLGREIERATKDDQAPAPDAQTPAQAAPEPKKPLAVEVREPKPPADGVRRRYVAPVVNPLATSHRRRRG